MLSRKSGAGYCNLQFIDDLAGISDQAEAQSLVGLGMGITPHPFHRSRRAELPHRAPTSITRKSGVFSR